MLCVKESDFFGGFTVANGFFQTELAKYSCVHEWERCHFVFCEGSLVCAVVDSTSRPMLSISERWRHQRMLWTYRNGSFDGDCKSWLLGRQFGIIIYSLNVQKIHNIAFRVFVRLGSHFWYHGIFREVTILEERVALIFEKARKVSKRECNWLIGDVTCKWVHRNTHRYITHFLFEYHRTNRERPTRLGVSPRCLNILDFALISTELNWTRLTSIPDPQGSPLIHSLATNLAVKILSMLQSAS